MSPQEYCEICVRGHLDPYWSERLGGLQIHVAGENTQIAGHLADQTALHGLLTQIRDAGLTLLSVMKVEKNQTEDNSL